MTDRELLQQALDMLDDINQCSLPPTGIPLPAEIDHVMEALRARLAQPEPEPVAWTVRGLITDFSRDFSAYQTKTYTVPLYTAPPQREWVGLTNEEIKDILDCGRGGLVDIKKAEQKLKEKNG